MADTMHVSRVVFWVPGEPEAQGSMRSFKDRGGNIRTLHSSGPKLRAWRNTIEAVARKEVPWKLVKPQAVAVRYVFYMSRPITRKKAPHPVYRKDLDKLERAVGDALTRAEVWTDDVQVIHSDTEKRWAGQGGPGVEITILAVEE